MSRNAVHDAVGRLVDAFDPREARVAGFTRELLELIEEGDYSPEEIERATTRVIRHGDDYFPKMPRMVKALDAERARRVSNVVRPSFGDWRSHVDVLFSWIVGRALTVGMWSGVAPLRANDLSLAVRPSEQDDLVEAWLPKADIAALSAMADLLQLANDPAQRGEDWRVSELRRAIRYDLKDYVHGLRPTERAELIRRRILELRRERAEAAL